MTGGARKISGCSRGIAALLGLLAGLCTVFALIVTLAEGWQEHAQTQWPEATARVDRCGLDQTSTGRRANYDIHCVLSYAVGAEQIVVNIHSGHAPSRQVWQYPPNQIRPLEEWVEKHPPGTSIALRYDPRNHRKAVLVATDMPDGGTRTQNNLKLLGFFAASCALLLVIMRTTRPKSPGQYTWPGKAG